MFGRRRTDGGRWFPIWPMVLGTASVAGMAFVRHASPVMANLGYGLVLTVAQIVLVVAVGVAGFGRAGDARERRPWKLLFVGFLLMLAGNVLLAMSNAPTVDGRPPSLPLTIVGVATGVVAAVPTMLGLLAFPMRPMHRREWGRFWLDMLTVVGGGGMVLWYFLIGPALERAKGAYELLSLVPPIPQGALMFAISAVMMRTTVRSVRHPMSMLLLGLGTNLLVDLAMTYQVMIYGRVAPNLVLGIALLAGQYTVVIAAAVQIRTARVAVSATASPIGSRRPSWLPSLALALGYGLLVFAACTSEPYPWAGLVAGAVTMTAAVAGRQWLVMRDNHQMLLRDALTGLSSRTHFHDALVAAMRRGRRTGHPTGIMIIDLDGFKQVNDTLGHAAGDDLLIRFADILRRSLRAGDTAGRLGGDEFAVVLPDVMDAGSAVTVARRILDQCLQPVSLAGTQVRIRASVGIALAGTGDVPTAGEPVGVNELMQRADLAMYVAKRRTGHSCEVYRDELADAAVSARGERSRTNRTAVPEAARPGGPALTPDEREELERLRVLLAEVQCRAALPREIDADSAVC